jgi:hypothetical protein
MSPNCSDGTDTSFAVMAMDLPAVSFEALMCQQGFQCFLDQAVALRVMYRVLVPGARVLLSVWKSASPLQGVLRDCWVMIIRVTVSARWLMEGALRADVPMSSVLLLDS